MDDMCGIASAATQQAAESAAGVPPQFQGESGPCWLRLVRGTALEPVWQVRTSAASEEGYSVGSDPACDWQVHAPDMPPLACWLRVLAGTLFVRAAGTCEVSVDGHGLGSMWTPVAHGARLDAGGALIEVGLFGRSRAAQTQRLRCAPERIPDVCELPRPVVDGARQAELEAAWHLPKTTAQLRMDAQQAWQAAALELDGQAQQRDGWTATIFGADDSAPAEGRPTLEVVAGLRRFSVAGIWIAGSLVACAYGCWVLLLDHLH
jgi:hypothetical protein